MGWHGAAHGALQDASLKREVSGARRVGKGESLDRRSGMARCETRVKARGTRGSGHGSGVRAPGTGTQSRRKSRRRERTRGAGSRDGSPVSRPSWPRSETVGVAVRLRLSVERRGRRGCSSRKRVTESGMGFTSTSCVNERWRGSPSWFVGSFLRNEATIRGDVAAGGSTGG